MNYLKDPWKHDVRSDGFSHAKLFGVVTKFAESLHRPLHKPENQLMTLRCGAYAGAAGGGYIYNQRFHPDYQAILIGKIQGTNVDVGGSDPNAAMKSQCYIQGGYLPWEECPIHLETDGLAVSGNPNNYVADLANEASNYGGEGFVKPDGGADIFDGIRSALQMAYDPKTQRGAPVQAFGRFYAEWEYAKYIPMTYTQFAGYHSYLFVDWITINGVAYLIAQNSYGEGIGDGGYHYFPREVVNREFGTLGTTLKIIKPLTKEQIALAKQTTPLGRIQRQIAQLWYDFSLWLIGAYGKTI